MKKTTMALGLLLLATPLWAAEEEAAVATLPGFSEQLSYTLGMVIGQALKKVESKLEYPMVIQGLMDTVEGKKTLVTPERAAELKQELNTELRLKKIAEQKELGEKNLKEGEAFLAANREKPGVVTTESGLQYEVLRPGEGPKAQENDTVTVHYRGTLLDGTVFDSSYERKEPAVFPVKEVIPGWSEAVRLMEVGGKYRIYLPAKLGYGEQSAGPLIGPQSVLVFELELLAIKNEAPPAS